MEIWSTIWEIFGSTRALISEASAATAELNLTGQRRESLARTLAAGLREWRNIEADLCSCVGKFCELIGHVGCTGAQLESVVEWNTRDKLRHDDFLTRILCGLFNNEHLVLRLSVEPVSYDRECQMYSVQF